ncbi:hypothetical protein HMPREF0298_1897 [Corynebacterium lipophiloflavum DSM 44291]|uniref:DUF4258 domain-containing protein n=2 Tax=Corynebacterium lipophiloflavum TaxID=161889 RepID=C0XTX7_CORLD|nr:hypothetical protein HMPREF0298_1897 [Corynebacterium lipophiloflavum DSM 44291]
MAERGICESEVHAVLAAPDLTRPGNKPGRRVYERKLSRITCVVTVDGTDPIEIITAFCRDEGEA